MSEGKLYGKYRGMVLNNIDPMQMGRLLVQVPDVGGLLPSSWAMPCVPVAGIQNGTFAVPIIGSGVWVEFEHGDIDYPIWVGCFWGSAAEVPTAALVPPLPLGQNIVFQTALQHSVIISDVVPAAPLPKVPAPAPPGTGGVILRSPSGSMIVVNDTGIYLTNGLASIDLVGASVLINKVALVVT